MNSGWSIFVSGCVSKTKISTIDLILITSSCQHSGTACGLGYWSCHCDFENRVCTNPRLIKIFSGGIDLKCSGSRLTIAERCMCRCQQVCQLGTTSLIANTFAVHLDIALWIIVTPFRDWQTSFVVDWDYRVPGFCAEFFWCSAFGVPLHARTDNLWIVAKCFGALMQMTEHVAYWTTASGPFAIIHRKGFDRVFA